MRNRQWTVIAVCTFILCLQAGTVLAAPPTVDLTKAVVVTRLEADPVEAGFNEEATGRLAREPSCLLGRKAAVWVRPSPIR